MKSFISGIFDRQSDSEVAIAPPVPDEHRRALSTQKPLPVDAVIHESGENDYSTSSLLENRNDVGIQLLCNAAASKSLDVRYHRRLIFEIFKHDRRIVFRQNSPENSAAYTYCARQKHVAKIMMERQGVPVPPGDIFQDYSRALRYFKQSDAEVTVKPSDGSSGYGVTSDVSSEDQFNVAWEFARKESRSIVVEKNIPGEDIRVIVIGGKAEAAYVRIPAHVVGNGQNTIQELVTQKNSVRAQNPSLRLDLIERFDLLERNGVTLNHVPASGEKVQLTSVANASAGGETVQIFDFLDDEVLKIAEQAALCFPGLVQVGVDLIYVSPQYWKAGEPRAYVIEVNSNPGICDAVFPSYGRSIDVPEKLLSHVFSLKSDHFPSRSIDPQIVLAEAYQYQQFENFWGEDGNSQIALVKQAAFGLNIDVESLSDSAFYLKGKGEQCLYHSGMPESVCMISRKVTRNRDWMAEILPASPSFTNINFRRLNRFRLLVVYGRLVSVLLIRADGAGQGILRTEVGDLVHSSVLPILKDTLSAIFNPTLVGIDLFTNDISSDLEGQPWIVKDAMCNPSLSWHHFPDRGTGRDVATMLVRGSLPECTQGHQSSCERVVITGDVGGADFRRWIKLLAISHSVSGWVKAREEKGVNTVEAVFEGTPVAIDNLIELCQRGPGAGIVESVSREEQPYTGKLNFLIIG